MSETSPESEKSRLLSLPFSASQTVGLLAVLGVLALLVAPLMTQRGSYSPRLECKNNLKLLGLALHNYHDEHGHFPPAFTVDDNGRRLHSWRTLLLPFIEENELYEKIDLTKPWSHPANALARAACPDSFRCPSADLPEGFTSYKAVVGTRCAFPVGGSTTSINDVSDGTSLTAFVLETNAEHASHWMNPHDDGAIDFAAFLHSKPATVHKAGVYMLFVDGSVHFIGCDTEPEIVEGLMTIAGGEVIDTDEF